MNKRLHNFSLFFLMVFVAQFYAQTDDSIGEVRLSFADDKRVFKIGEPIKLVMTFTAKSGAFLTTNEIDRDFDELILTPKAGAIDWKEEIHRIYGGYNDSIKLIDISGKSYDFKFFLNTRIRFDKPGKYSLRVNTKRVKPVGSKMPERRFGGVAVMLSTNSIEFEIAEMPENEEAERIKSLSAEIDSTSITPEKRQLAVKELSFLTGKPSTQEKARRYLAYQSNEYRQILNYHSEILSGLSIARDKNAAIKIFEAALGDLSRAPDANLINTLTTLRRLKDFESEPPVDEDARSHYERENKRRTEIQNEYLGRLFESLNNRTGKSRSFAAYVVFTMIPRDDFSNSWFEATRRIVLENFDDYHLYSRDWLLNNFFQKIKTSALIPSIKKMLTEAEAKNPVASITKTTALKRFLDLDEQQARQYFINEILAPNSYVDVKILAKLRDKTLPEAEQDLLQQIKNLAESKDNLAAFQLKYKSLLAARYATSKIYKDLLKLYQSKENVFDYQTKSSFLAYLGRFHSKETVPLIEKAFADSQSPDPSIFYLTQIGMNESLEKVLQKRLFLDSTNISATSAYYLSRYGSAKNRKLIEKRYQIWLAKRRLGNLADSNESMYQTNIIEALINAKNWDLTEREFQQLKLSCLTQFCRDRFSKAVLPTKSQKAAREY